ncbi:hypothetical protein IWQ62_005307, partial [Dispira parvispora]
GEASQVMPSKIYSEPASTAPGTNPPSKDHVNKHEIQVQAISPASPAKWTHIHGGHGGAPPTASTTGTGPAQPLTFWAKICRIWQTVRLRSKFPLKILHDYHFFPESFKFKSMLVLLLIEITLHVLLTGSFVVHLSLPHESDGTFPQSAILSDFGLQVLQVMYYLTFRPIIKITMTSVKLWVCIVVSVSNFLGTVLYLTVPSMRDEFLGVGYFGVFYVARFYMLMLTACQLLDRIQQRKHIFTPFTIQITKTIICLTGYWLASSALLFSLIYSIYGAKQAGFNFFDTMYYTLLCLVNGPTNELVFDSTVARLLVIALLFSTIIALPNEFSKLHTAYMRITDSRHPRSRMVLSVRDYSVVVMGHLTCRSVENMLQILFTRMDDNNVAFNVILVDAEPLPKDVADLIAASPFTTSVRFVQYDGIDYGFISKFTRYIIKVYVIADYDESLTGELDPQYLDFRNIRIAQQWQHYFDSEVVPITVFLQVILHSSLGLLTLHPSLRVLCLDDFFSSLLARNAAAPGFATLAYRVTQTPNAPGFRDDSFENELTTALLEDPRVLKYLATDPSANWLTYFLSGQANPLVRQQPAAVDQVHQAEWYQVWERDMCSTLLMGSLKSFWEQSQIPEDHSMKENSHSSLPKVHSFEFIENPETLGRSEVNRGIHAFHLQPNPFRTLLDTNRIPTGLSGELGHRININNYPSREIPHDLVLGHITCPEHDGVNPLPMKNHVVILDYQHQLERTTLPLIKQLRQAFNQKDLPVVVVSGKWLPKPQRRQLQALGNVHRVQSKPHDGDSLVKANLAQARTVVVLHYFTNDSKSQQPNVALLTQRIRSLYPGLPVIQRIPCGALPEGPYKIRDFISFPSRTLCDALEPYVSGEGVYTDIIYRAITRQAHVMNFSSIDYPGFPPFMFLLFEDEAASSTYWTTASLASLLPLAHDSVELRPRYHCGAVTEALARWQVSLMGVRKDCSYPQSPVKFSM